MSNCRQILYMFLHYILSEFEIYSKNIAMSERRHDFYMSPNTVLSWAVAYCLHNLEMAMSNCRRNLYMYLDYIALVCRINDLNIACRNVGTTSTCLPIQYYYELYCLHNLEMAMSNCRRILHMFLHYIALEFQIYDWNIAMSKRRHDSYMSPHTILLWTVLPS